MKLNKANSSRATTSLCDEFTVPHAIPVPCLHCH